MTPSIAALFGRWSGGRRTCGLGPHRHDGGDGGPAHRRHRLQL